MRKSLQLALLTALGAASLAAAPRHLMLVVSKGLPGVTIYDADSQTPICSAKTGVSPHEAAFSLDGKMAYVPVYGSTAVGKAGTDEHTLHFIRTSDCKEMAVLDTGENKRPHGIAVGASGRIYLTAEVAKSLMVIDPEQHKIVATIPTDSPYSHMIAVMPDEKTVFVSNVQSKTISVLDVPNHKLAKVIDTKTENQRMTLSPDHHWFVTSMGPDHKLAFYRTADQALDFTVPIDGAPFVARFSADGRYIYDAGMQGGKIHIWKVDVAQRKVVATTSEPIGTAVGSLVVNPFTKDVYLSDAASSRIFELDPDSLAVKKSLAAEKTPDCMAFIALR